MIDLKTEWPKIREVALQHGVDPLFMLAIRHAENGRPGREFGVLDGESNDFDRQLSKSTKTIRGFLDTYPHNPLIMMINGSGFRRLVYTEAFILFAQRRYCPIGAENDPEGLNKNWATNVSKHYYSFVRASSPEFIAT